ncbi:DUF3307 domain-containing protein [Tenacibaculum sp. MEBiC06402]|uniref:DUF3307 domain-containing protein n=1 Tax=unclassified Tenacibaculum TaxID=2635139 RepID=UPI003B9D8025
MLFIQLLLVHILGDFVLQPSSWVKNKMKYKIKSYKLYAHIGVHAFLLFIVALINQNFWLGFLLILITHYIIDVAKLYLQKKVAANILFFGDQLLHIFFLGLATYLTKPFKIDFSKIFTEKVLLLITALLFIVYVAPILIQLIVKQWEPEKDKLDHKQSLKEAGKYIGILERLFVFMFVIFGKWEGVGFLLAAKSIFRFGDLTTAKDRKLTEYILIGTLISFGLAILAGLIYNKVIQLF